MKDITINTFLKQIPIAAMILHRHVGLSLPVPWQPLPLGDRSCPSLLRQSCTGAACASLGEGLGQSQDQGSLCESQDRVQPSPYAAVECAGGPVQAHVRLKSKEIKVPASSQSSAPHFSTRVGRNHSQLLFTQGPAQSYNRQTVVRWSEL